MSGKPSHSEKKGSALRHLLTCLLKYNVLLYLFFTCLKEGAGSEGEILRPDWTGDDEREVEDDDEAEKEGEEEDSRPPVGQLLRPKLFLV